MLQNINMRNIVKSLYDGRCTIIEVEKYTENKTTKFRDIIITEDEPCRISHYTKKKSENSDMSYNSEQSVKLFISPDITIKEGSKISVTQNNVTKQYRNSGTPAVYSGHQEIMLILEDWV